jgi:hypothetical protein
LTNRSSLVWAGLFALPLLILLGARRRGRISVKTLVHFLGVLILALLVSQSIGCGGHFTPQATTNVGLTPPGIYYLLVTVKPASSPSQEPSTYVVAIVPVTVTR